MHFAEGKEEKIVIDVLNEILMTSKSTCTSVRGGRTE